MATFQINKQIKIVCDASKTRNGFKHTATLYLKGVQRESVKINYLNRTWERYEFDSVIEKLADDSKSLTDAQKNIVKEWVKNRNGSDDAGMQRLKTTGMIAMLGDVFGQTQKEKNDWKARMLKAGLGNYGLEMPEDWNTLSEDEKERRLNLVISQLNKNKR